VEKWDDRMMRLSGGERICTIFSAVLAQLQSVTDGGTARRSHKRAELLYIASLTTNFQNAIFYISAMPNWKTLYFWLFFRLFDNIHCSWPTAQTEHRSMHMVSEFSVDVTNCTRKRWAQCI